jgi:hypothetical protein
MFGLNDLRPPHLVYFSGHACDAALLFDSDSKDEQTRVEENIKTYSDLAKENMASELLRSTFVSQAQHQLYIRRAIDLRYLRDGCRWCLLR